MTKADLLKAYYLVKEIEIWTEERKEVKSSYQKQKINKKLTELKRKRSEVLNFIMSIDDPQIRLIAKLRCINGLTWNAVADKVGGMNSEYTVKKRFYRFLEKTGT